MAGIWAVTGVEIDAATMRSVSYDGTEGIRGPGQLKVATLVTPGGGVRVLPGVCDVANRYVAEVLDSYRVTARTAQTVPIAATGSGGSRTDLVVARIYDPEYVTIPAGKSPGPAFEVIQGVPSNATAEYVKALAYPALALARVTLPASTATVTAGMITDLRALARPRQGQVRRTAVSAAPVSLTATGTPVKWPSTSIVVPVPSWATHASVIASVSGMYAEGPSASASLRIVVGTSGQSSEAAVSSPSIARVGTSLSGDFVLSVADRAAGQVPVEIRGVKLGGASFYADHATPVTVDVLFEERTV